MNIAVIIAGLDVSYLSSMLKEVGEVAQIVCRIWLLCRVFKAWNNETEVSPTWVRNTFVLVVFSL